jgi:hypothetical protein
LQNGDRTTNENFLLIVFAKLGLSFTPLQESYSRYGFLVTHSWMKMLWEKLSMFNI